MSLGQGCAEEAVIGRGQGVVPNRVVWSDRRGWMWSRVLGYGAVVRREEEVRRNIVLPFRLGRRRASGESGLIGRHSGVDVVG